ncbi:hypothetical protein ABEF95_000711 [Exophiala dermatitidis]
MRTAFWPCLTASRCLGYSIGRLTPTARTLGRQHVHASRYLSTFTSTSTSTYAPSWRLEDLSRGSEETSPLIIYLTSDNPYHNLSLEHYVLRRSHPSSRILLFYTNRPCVVFGRNQNPWLETDLKRLRDGLAPEQEHEQEMATVETGSSTTNFSQRSVPIDLVRRRSGGGTVFHDSGNLNYSVIVPNSQSFAFKRSTHAEMVVRALLSSEMKQALNSISERGEGNRLFDINNLDIRVNDRNDIVMRRSNADGNGNELPWLKISGSAFKLTRGRALHHGTLLYSSPHIDKISDLLRSPGREYIRAKGVESVRSKVANLVFTPDAHHRDQVRKSIMEAVVREFWDMYGAGQPRQPGMNEISLGDAEVYQTPEVAAGVSELDSDAWRFGQTPRFDFDSGVLDGMSVGFQANHGVLEHLTLRDANGGALIHRQKRQSGTEHEGDGLGHQPLDGVRLSDVASWRDLLSVEPAEQKVEKDQEEQGKAKDRAGQDESSPSDRNSDSSSRDIQVPDSLVRRIEAVFPRWRSSE